MAKIPGFLETGNIRQVFWRLILSLLAASKSIKSQSNLLLICAKKLLTVALTAMLKLEAKQKNVLPLFFLFFNLLSLLLKVEIQTFSVM